jgi:type IV pilus assembly protein PilW
MNSLQIRQLPSGIKQRANPMTHQHGLSLIELMISMVIGLVLVGGVLSIFVSTNQTAKLNDNLMRVQENARGAFEVMARDIREAGQNPCGSRKVANVLRSGGSIPVWTDWNLGTLRGYDNTEDETAIKAIGTTNTARVTGTDAVLVIRTGQDENTVASHDTVDKRFVLTAKSNYKENDIAFVCDALGSAIFQIYAVSSSGGVIGKNIDHQADVTNMNCGNFLSYSTPVTTCPTTLKTFDNTQPATPEVKIAPLITSFWYVGYVGSTQSKRSLYRSSITRSGTGGTTIIMATDEIIPDVQDLQITYLTRDGTTGALATNWVDATAVTDWVDDNTAMQVVAVKLDLTLQTTDKVSATQNPIQRHLIHVVALRNRDVFVTP